MDIEELIWVPESVQALYTIIDRDPQSLRNMDLSPFAHTPLHEASAKGKIGIAVELMMLMPSFATKLNTCGFSPLHLAVENSQVDMALELVKVDPSLIRLRGRGGVTPLHLVVEKGDIDLLAEFLMACPNSILDVNVSGETAFHMAVLKGRYQELKVLTGWIQRMIQNGAASIEAEIMNKIDHQGNTALHVAAYENKHQAIKTLLKCFFLDRNIKNKVGLTPLDVLRTNGHYMDKVTEKMLKRSGGKSKDALSKVTTSSEFLRSPITFWEYCSITTIRYRSGITDGTRNALQVINALVMAATYQAALQPPAFPNIHFKIVLWFLLWGFNTVAFSVSLFVTIFLLPLGREQILYNISIALPLLCSYGISLYCNTPNHTFVMVILFFTALLLGFPCYLLVIFFKWKRSSIKLLAIDPKSKLVLERLSTIV